MKIDKLSETNKEQAAKLRGKLARLRIREQDKQLEIDAHAIRIQMKEERILEVLEDLALDIGSDPTKASDLRIRINIEEGNIEGLDEEGKDIIVG